MMLGTVLCNMCERSGDIMSRSDMWTTPLNTLFFVISGAELELGVFRNLWFVLVGIIYVIVRSMGKYYGARASASFTGCSSKVTKYLGYTLLPQAGVALGMCKQAVTLSPEDGKIIKNIVLFAILIYELAGPSITHWALLKSGDIVERPKDKASHDRFKTPKDYKTSKTAK